MRTTSSDGTSIAFDRQGSGPPIVLVDGALCHRGMGPNPALAERLARHFTVLTYDRRGRGESGDTGPYAVEREVEDLAAVIDAAGAPVGLYGISSGGLLALEAAKALPGKVDRLALYEIPFVVDDSRPPLPTSFPGRLDAMIAASRRGAAVKAFMRECVRLPSMLVAAMPLFPAWGRLTAVAHTLAHDIAIMGGTQRGVPLSRNRWASVAVPTLVASGGKSPAWIRAAAAQLAEVLPNARGRTLEGQTHQVKPDALAPVLADFFAAAPERVPHATGGVAAG